MHASPIPVTLSSLAVPILLTAMLIAPVAGISDTQQILALHGSTKRAIGFLRFCIAKRMEAERNRDHGTWVH